MPQMAQMTQMVRIGTFVAVGLGGFLVQVAALSAFAALADIGVVPATLAAVELAVLHNFVWHERWTWGDRARRDSAGWLRRLGAFHASNGALSLGANVAITAALVAWMHAPLLRANTIAVAACAVLNFLAADRVVFRHAPEAVA